MSPASLPPPGEDLLRANLPSPCHLADRRALHESFRNDPTLLVVRPAPPSYRTRQNLDPPKATVRVRLNVIYNFSSKTPFENGQARSGSQ